MALTPGTKLGPYEITGAVGAGGMGEVYRARDTRLGRDVAIKVLPEAFAKDALLKERFDREARTISSLNHPHICTLYDVGHQDGVDFLVMELLEGDSLAERLKRGALPLAETLRIGMEMADALERAHRQGIVHRDLKPGNVVLTKSGAKLLDFGLAKPLGLTAAGSVFSGMATQAAPASPVTREGTVIGTLQYMSPEQVEGKEADARSDIFALGAVLYEMATGRRAFEGKSQISVASAILEKDPEPISRVQPMTPPALEHVVKTCLAKDPEERFQTAHDVKLQLRWIGEMGSQAGVPLPAVARRRRREWQAWALAALAGAALATAVWWTWNRSTDQAQAPMHLSIALAPGAIPTAGHFNEHFAISPDGKWVVYVVTQGGKQQLLLRGIRESEGKLINGTEEADQPFFSPDSQWIAFAAANALKKVPVSGGSPITICSLSTSDRWSSGFVGGAWGPDNRIVFVPEFNAGIWTVSADGGTPELLLKTDVEKDRIAYLSLQVLPDNKGILFTTVPGRALKSQEMDIAVLERGAREPRILVRGGSNARYVRSGHLLYVRNGALLAVSFDLSRLAVTGTPVSVIDGLERNQVGDSFYVVSETGTLVYEPGTRLSRGPSLVVVDRKGNGRAITDGSGFPQDFALSPDSRTVAARMVAVNDDLWTYDVARGTPLRLTFEPGDEIMPQWTADGTRVAFGTRTGKIFWKLADGTGEREEISRGDYPRYPASFSRDGKMLAFVEIHPSRQRDIWLMSLDGGRKAQPFQATDASEWAPKFSPDGHWIAYVSDESGRDEIYVRPVSSPGGRKRVSTEGGAWPAWNRNGRELFFLKGDKLVAVTLDAEGNPAGPERVVLDAPKLGDLQFQTDSPLYDVMPDGEHFVMLLRPPYPSPTHYNLVLNWFEELKRLAPAH
jgi:Tol biopolymer transport system component